MPTLAEKLTTTTPVSVLLRKARRMGFQNVNSLIALAVQRGCAHYYTDGLPALSKPPNRDSLGDDELTVLLMVGENAYEPTAIRIAAQLCRSPHIDPARLAKLAIMEKTERVLTHIARAGAEHDSKSADFWQTILGLLPQASPRQEPHLPHWSRFVSMPGIQRHGISPNQWLIPSE